MQSNDETPKREVKLHQIWRKIDPSGTTMDFEVIGFQAAAINSCERMARGRTKGGRRVLASVALMQRGERYQLVQEVAANPFQRRPRKRHPARDWAFPPGTPIFIKLDDGTTAACRTAGRAYDVRGFGYVDVTHPSGSAHLGDVRLDRSRMLGHEAALVLTEVCRATAKGEAYKRANDRELSALTRPKVARLVTRLADGRWLAKPEAFEMLCLDPTTGLSTIATAERRQAS